VDVIEEVEDELEKLKKTKKLIIVEGIKDKAALEQLGLSNIIVMKGRPLYKIFEDIKAEEVVLLVDLDKEGKEIYGKLKRGLHAQGIKTNEKLRNILFRTNLRQIEGLPHYLEKYGKYKN